jgi:hypothetical protein
MGSPIYPYLCSCQLSGTDYGRYELYYFHDIAPGYQSGIAQGVLGGLSALY